MVEQLRIEDCPEITSYHNSIYTSGYMFMITGSVLAGIDESYERALAYRADGGGIYIEQTAKVVIQDTRFVNLKGRYGGALYIHQDRLTTTSLTLGLGYRTLRVYLLSDVVFENCEAEFDGGAIFVKNPMKMSITNGSFVANSARREGGALMYLCEPTEREWEIDPDTPCSLEMGGQIDFVENSARVGGAIRWNLMEMDIGDPEANFTRQEDGSIQYGGLTFSGNQAEEYGPEIAAVAREIIRLDSVEQYLRYYDRSNDNTVWQAPLPAENTTTFFNNYTYHGVQSGGDVPTIFLGLIDKYG